MNAKDEITKDLFKLSVLNTRECHTSDPDPEMLFPIELKHIHEKALTLTRGYKQTEADLLEIIIQIRDHKIYRYFACTSVFEYCVNILKLDPGVVYGFTAVAKKIKEVPELKEVIKQGLLNVSTAKRITSVITTENKNEWFEKAENLTVRKLEREVAKVNPKEEVKERASYLNSKRVRLEMGLDEKLMLKIRRIQDLESQRQKRSVNLEEVFSVMTDLYLTKKDPIEKAERAKIRGRLLEKTSEHTVKKSSTWKEFFVSPTTQRSSISGSAIPVTATMRTPIPSAQKNKVHLRDQGQCQYVHKKTNQKCGHTRFIELHHKQPVYLGGAHDIDNLVTLCSEHHRMEHLQQKVAHQVLASII